MSAYSIVEACDLLRYYGGVVLSSSGNPAVPFAGWVTLSK